MMASSVVVKAAATRGGKSCFRRSRFLVAGKTSSSGGWRRATAAAPARSSFAFFSTHHNNINSSTAHQTAQGPAGSYAAEYAASLQDPVAFWGRQAAAVEWFENPTQILQQEGPFTSWFADGVMNLSYNCLDVHVNAGRGDQDALVYDSPVTGQKQRLTYKELLDQVATAAGALQNLGVQAGDRVIIYMPMIPQAVISMLACCRIGAVHSVVFGGFAAPELAARIVDCQPAVIVSASCGVEPSRIVPYKPLLDEALAIAAAQQSGSSSVKHTVIVQRNDVVPDAPEAQMEQPRDLDWHELMKQTTNQPAAVPLVGTHPVHILYTSGTTGRPKGVVRHAAGYAVALKYSMSAFYDTTAGETMWAASDIGWIVGHSYIVYAPLLAGCTSILYEGKPVGTPDAGAFWRVIQEYQVKTFFCAPTAFRAIKQADPAAELVHEYDLSCLENVFLAGEHSDPDTLRYCQHALQDYDGPVQQAVDHWWQTELGWPGVGNAVGLGRIPARFGACAAPVPGYDLRVVDGETGAELGPNQLGDMVIKLPLPPGTLSTLYNHDERYVSEYLTKYPGFYDAADAAFIDEDGYIHIVGRMDDVINTAGHRLSTGAMEEILMEHSQVADCAVFPVSDEIKGEVPVGLVVVNQGSTISEEQLRADLIQLVRESLGPVAAFRLVAPVKALPKTRSGKILRSTMSDIANGKEYTITPTVEDPTIFDYLEPEIQRLVGSRRNE